MKALYIVDLLHITLNENIVGTIDEIAAHHKVVLCCSPDDKDTYMQMTKAEHWGNLALSCSHPEDAEEMYMTSFGEQPRAEAEVIHISKVEQIEAAHSNMFYPEGGWMDSLHEEAVLRGDFDEAE